MQVCGKVSQRLITEENKMGLGCSQHSSMTSMEGAHRCSTQTRIFRICYRQRATLRQFSTIASKLMLPYQLA